MRYYEVVHAITIRMDPRLNAPPEEPLIALQLLNFIDFSVYFKSINWICVVLVE